MRSPQPPRMATWLLKSLSCQNEPLAGDLLEEFRQGRPAAWYWRQVMTAIFVSLSRQASAHRMLGVLAVGFVGVYWIGNHIPAPGMNTEMFAVLAQRATLGSVLYNLFTGGNLARVTIFALGIMPYISALVIRQILLFIWPYFRRLSRDEERGRRTIMLYTRYVAILLCIVQSLGIALFLEEQTTMGGGLRLVDEPGWSFRLMLVLTLTTATACLIWLSEQITERGIGWGVSLVFFAGLVVGLPGAVMATLDQMQTGRAGLSELVWFVMGMIVCSAMVLFVDPGSDRRLHHSASHGGS